MAAASMAAKCYGRGRGSSPVSLLAMKASPVRRPTPEPVESDDVRIVAIGTAGWLVAFLVLLPFAGRLADDDRGSWPWICLAGVGLGLVGLVGLIYTRRRRGNGRRVLPRRAVGPPAPRRQG